MSLDKEILEKLVGACGKVLTGDDIGADYAHDELPGGKAYMPDAVCEAGSTEEVAAVLSICNECGVPVTVRGAGTGQVGGSVPIKGGVVLSVKGMNKILELDEAAKTIRVQAGVLLQDVKEEADKHGLYYPPDPGEKTATIGGNAATNAGGPCALKYGKTRDYVLDAVVVLADGSVKTLADCADVVGSEGTLAVITELKLKLVDKPGSSAILIFPFMDTESCIKAAQTIAGAGYDPAVAEYMDTDLIEFSGKVTGNPVFPVEMDGERVGATLMVTLEADDEDAVMEKMESIAEMAEELECLDILVGDTPSMMRDFWAAHDAFHTSMESGAKCATELNIDVPAEHIAEMVEFAKALGTEKGVKVMAYAHVCSGGLHLHIAADCSREEFAPVADELAAAVYKKCSEFGGSIKGEYGIGYSKVQYLEPSEKEKLAAEKAEFDPKGILNPGKII